MTLLDGLSCSAFGDSIRHIIGICTKPKVRGIYAQWIVAARTVMADVQTVWDGAVMKLIGEAMRASDFAIDTQTPIPASKMPCPQPAILWSVLADTLPKALFSLCVSKAGRMSSDIANWLPLNVTMPHVIPISEGGRLTAAAHTEAGGVGAARWCNFSMMVVNKANRLALDPSSALVSLWRNWRGLTASTFTKFMRSILSVHVHNYTAFDVSGAWQKHDNLVEAMQ